MNWRELNAQLNQMTETEVKGLLDVELVNRQRVTFVERLHQRYCTLRATRERAEMMALLAPPAQVA
jgi:hypothetical protein